MIFFDPPKNSHKHNKQIYIKSYTKIIALGYKTNDTEIAKDKIKPIKIFKLSEITTYTRISTFKMIEIKRT